MADSDDSARPSTPQTDDAVPPECPTEIVVPIGVERVSAKFAITAVVAVAAKLGRFQPAFDPLRSFPPYVTLYGCDIGDDSEAVGKIEMLPSDGAHVALRLAMDDAATIFAKLGIKPRCPAAPLADDYAGTWEQNAWYEITVDEFGRLAAAYGVPFERATPSDTARDIATTASATNAVPAKLKIGANPRDVLDTHIAARAHELHAADNTSTMHAIAAQIRGELEGAGYAGERGDYLSVATIEKAIPPGLTGGRRKNGRKKPTG
ncbi:hypothetical protein PUN4_460019 [Paraburkholderia unamae]|uniref:hypothetical protein n=1 Tax=Paraburkholderia unamae TaxID=219649 RepID=UPI001CAD4166|nr:hypothetical protein [Paraburkholderia unamae]CAG9264434.1 hypothetical protein PUN4_460019 [Paraburkholderia unamae]